MKNDPYPKPTRENFATIFVGSFKITMKNISIILHYPRGPLILNYITLN